MLVIATLVVAVAALIDLRTGRIPNWLTLGGIAVGLLGHGAIALASDGPRGAALSVGTALLGAALGAAGPLVLYRLHALGGGDVKLFAALGVLLGPMLGLEAQLLSFVCAALVLPLRLAWAGNLFETLRRSLAVALGLVLPAAGRPPVNEAAMSWFRLGPAIFAGTVWAILARSVAS